jgi:hypothetical protein
MIKALRKLGIEGMYLNIIKTIYDKPIANITLSEEKLKTFPLKSGAIKQEEEIKGIKIDNEIIKVSLFVDDMILYIKDQKKTLSKNS